MASWQCELLMALCLLVSCVAADNSGWRRELTTRSHDAVGFHENIVHSPTEDQLIIAVVDSGIWPESPSFSDQGLGPPPAKWKGICDTGNSPIPFKCNNKIIGARFYLPYQPLPAGEESSPRDTNGHGTHVAATVAGVLVRNVSVHGIGIGTARGAVPRARLAIYKGCWEGICSLFIPGVEDAVKDGADIISVSAAIINGGLPLGHQFSYATFQAMKAGLFLSFSAGNNNTLEPFTVSNTEPWVTTVGNSAGSGTDYVTYVTSGDGKRFEGALLNIVDNGKTMYPLVRNEEVTNATDPEEISRCNPEYMNPESVKGKIILCENKPDSIRSNFDHLGCAGLLVKGWDEAFYYHYKEAVYYRPVGRTPLIILRGDDFRYLTEYYKNSNSTGKPATASIEKSVSASDTAPRSALSSCRGPSLSDVNILKPDVSAPGVNEIDAVPGDAKYNFFTGTSMSAPFLAGIGAYIKSFHPTWSPAAIKSALMTTATPMTDPFKNQGALAFGSGQVDPLRATDPGLVYDIGEQDYVKYLCQLGESNSQFLYNTTHELGYDCAKIPVEKGWTLNYPSFAVPVFPDQPFVSLFQRTLTNVGNSSISNYKVIISAPKELTVKVEPSVLAFTQVEQKLSYTLTVSGQLGKSSNSDMPVLSASIVWTDGSHQVRSPIAVFEKPVDLQAQLLKTHGFDNWS